MYEINSIVQIQQNLQLLQMLGNTSIIPFSKKRWYQIRHEKSATHLSREYKTWSRFKENILKAREKQCRFSVIREIVNYLNLALKICIFLIHSIKELDFLKLHT